MAPQGGPFVVGSCFGLKSDGFAWECPQKVKKTSSDILVGFILTVNLQYSVNVAPNRGLLRFQLSSLCWFCGQKCDVKTYILRTRCAQGQFKVSLCDTVFVYIYPTAKYLALRMLVQAMYLGLRIRYLSCHGFVWECRQEVKKTSSDISTLNLQYLVNMAPSRGFLRFQSFET